MTRQKQRDGIVSKAGLVTAGFEEGGQGCGHGRGQKTDLILQDKTSPVNTFILAQ